MNDPTPFLPCPFCGTEITGLTVTKRRAMTEYSVWCSHCATQSGIYYDPEIAKNAWNRRADKEAKKP